MIQKLRMFGHFVAWCARHTFKAMWSTLMALLIFPRFIRQHYEDGKRQFRQNFSYGLLNYILSLFIAFAFSAMFSMFMFGASPTVEDQDKVFTILVVAFAIDTLFYFTCFIAVTYEKFLADYDHVFTILKESDDV